MPITTPPLRLLRVLLPLALLIAPFPALGQTPAQPVVLPPAQPPPPAPPPPPPPPGWAGSLGAGMALTSGNSDTSTINMAYEILRDVGGDVVLKSAGLYLRSGSEGDATVDRAAVDARLDYRLTPRLSAFGQTTYARDRFKEIDYLIAPTAGLSLAVVRTPRIEWTTDGSLGVVYEKNTGLDGDASGAVLAGERFLFKMNDTTRLIHAASGLWKMDDFGDSFYNFSAGVATSLASRLELKVEFLNTYKRQPTNPTLDKNDQSLVLSVVYKF
jgi:putative salt-induced outer membrane protein YdiY